MNLKPGKLYRVCHSATDLQVGDVVLFLRDTKSEIVILYPGDCIVRNFIGKDGLLKIQWGVSNIDQCEKWLEEI